MDRIQNATVISLSARLEWNPTEAADAEFRLQIYHRYPSGETEVGKALFTETGETPLAVVLDNLSVPIVDGGRITFIVYFAFRDGPTGAYQMQAAQEFQLDASAYVRAVGPADMEGLSPPQS